MPMPIAKGPRPFGRRLGRIRGRPSRYRACVYPALFLAATLAFMVYFAAAVQRNLLEDDAITNVIGPDVRALADLDGIFEHVIEPLGNGNNDERASGRAPASSPLQDRADEMDDGGEADQGDGDAEEDEAEEDRAEEDVAGEDDADFDAADEDVATSGGDGKPSGGGITHTPITKAKAAEPLGLGSEDDHDQAWAGAWDANEEEEEEEEEEEALVAKAEIDESEVDAKIEALLRENGGDVRDAESFLKEIQGQMDLESFLKLEAKLKKPIVSPVSSRRRRAENKFREAMWKNWKQSDTHVKKYMGEVNEGFQGPQKKKGGVRYETTFKPAWEVEARANKKHNKLGLNNPPRGPKMAVMPVALGCSEWLVKSVPLHASIGAGCIKNPGPRPKKAGAVSGNKTKRARQSTAKRRASTPAQ